MIVHWGKKLFRCRCKKQWRWYRSEKWNYKAENKASNNYTKKEFQNLQTGQREENLLPPSNVLHYTLETGDWVCVRPSGTEPKIKIYYGVKADSMQRAEEAAQAVDQAICQRMGVEG